MSSSGSDISNNPGLYAGTKAITVLKPTGDGRPGVWEFIHNDTAGYLYHLMCGVNMGSGQALIGMGIDNGGVGLFVNNKKTGIGINIQQNDTITSATAYGIYAGQSSTVAPLIHIDQANGAQKSLRIVTSETTDDLKDCFQVVSPGTNKGGSIMAKSGNIFWWSDIIAHDGGKIRNRAAQVNTDNNQTMMESGAFRVASFSGTSGTFWHHQITGSGQSTLIQNSDTTSGGPDSNVTTWLTAIETKQVSNIAAGTQIGFYGVTPVARAAAIASPTSDTVGTKAAIDAIRSALTGIGVTF